MHFSRCGANLAAATTRSQLGQLAFSTSAQFSWTLKRMDHEYFNLLYSNIM